MEPQIPDEILAIIGGLYVKGVRTQKVLDLTMMQSNQMRQKIAELEAKLPVPAEPEKPEAE